MAFPVILTRRKSVTKDWVQCNSTPVKVCKLPVHGLTEGDSYHFRVRAVNSAGISLPSRMSSGVIAADVESDVEGMAQNTQRSNRALICPKSIQDVREELEQSSVSLTQSSHRIVVLLWVKYTISCWI